MSGMSEELRRRLNILESSMAMDEEGFTTVNPVVVTEQEETDEKSYVEKFKAVKNELEERNNEYEKYLESVNSQLLESGIYTIVEHAIGKTTMSLYTESSKAMLKSMIHEFVQEQGGVYKMLNEMKGKTEFLDSMAFIIEDVASDYEEKADPNNPDSLTVDSEKSLDFFNNLDGTEELEDVADIIKQRVSRANEDFAAKMVTDREDIKDLQYKTKEYIDSIKTGDAETDEAIKQEATQDLAVRIDAIKHNPKSVYENLVLNLSKFLITNEETRNDYMNNGKLDMDLVNEKVDVLYTFLETVNTCKFADVTPEFVTEFVTIK